MDVPALPLFEPAHPGPLRDQLVAAVLDGSETSTSSLLQVDDGDDDPRPAVRFAAEEREGCPSVAQWREAHEGFWRRQVLGAALADDTVVVAQRFVLVERLEGSR